MSLDERLLRLANAYQASGGDAPLQCRPAIPYPDGRPQAIAAAYTELRPYNSAARDSFNAMAEDEAAQYSWVAELIDIDPWRGDGQPYSLREGMIQDVREDQHLWVFVGGNAHPCRTHAQVFRGRAVHDIFAHALAGYSFGEEGELAAFRLHAQMYSAAARPALAADNLGQNCWYNHAPVNAGVPHDKRTWPEQKVDLLPRHLWEDLLV